MIEKRRKFTLSEFILTEVVSGQEHQSFEIKFSSEFSYYIKHVVNKTFEFDSERGTHEVLKEYKYNLYPIILDSNGLPWYEANIYILDRIINSLKIVMGTYSNIANDLVDFKNFVDTLQINWKYFEKNKLYRPTYRYRAYLKNQIENNQIKLSTAQRRMSTIISFYRWALSEKIIEPEFPMWKENDRYIDILNSYGEYYQKKLLITDVSINNIKSTNPYSEIIIDGGKLRPLNREEQYILIRALIKLKNYEMFLIHLFSLVSGARIQTILTFRIKHVLIPITGSSDKDVRISAGPGTGIDTKNNKKIVLHLPLWFYQKLHIYALSEKAKRRRKKSFLKDSEDQFLFLSNRGIPYYNAKEYTSKFRESYSLHHDKNGQTVRQFIRDKVIPYVQNTSENPLKYQFHDLRASFGMNITDEQLQYVSKGEISLHDAREFVKNRMCHESTSTTDLYLKYRQNLKVIRKITSSYSEHLENLIFNIENEIYK